MGTQDYQGEKEEEEEICDSKDNDDQRPFVSFLSEVPPHLKKAMEAFIERHPSWDQYRLIQAALAGFLVQNGVESRSVTRLYLDNMFSRKTSE